jgi:multiple sugar transport system substrate-binding protein
VDQAGGKMAKIDFLTVILNRGAIPQVNHLFKRFQKETQVAVEASFVGWDTVWHELVNIGIYHRGADVAEVGTTWLESLVAMNALRPFSPAEVARCGGKSAYIPATWSSVSIGNDDRVWGIPIRCDVRVIFYWKDMFERAGVDPDTAFESIPNIQKSLEKLKSVVSTPWGIATDAGDPNIIQAMASWVWAFGGDFVTPNCNKVLLLESPSLDALRAYFGLYPYVPKGALGFVKRNVAAIMAGPWILQEFANLGFSKKDMAQIGIAIPPGPPFVGGTVLSIWHQDALNTHIGDSIKFIEFLTRPETQLEYCPFLGLLPTRQEAWEMPPFVDNPYYKVIRQALSMGRSLPVVPLWGMVEEKLNKGIAMVWDDLLTNQDADVDRAIHQHLEPVVTRLNLSLK